MMMIFQSSTMLLIIASCARVFLFAAATVIMMSPAQALTLNDPPTTLLQSMSTIHPIIVRHLQQQPSVDADDNDSSVSAITTTALSASFYSLCRQLSHLPDMMDCVCRAEFDLPTTIKTTQDASLIRCTTREMCTTTLDVCAQFTFDVTLQRAITSSTTAVQEEQEELMTTTATSQLENDVSTTTTSSQQQQSLLLSNVVSSAFVEICVVYREAPREAQYRNGCLQWHYPIPIVTKKKMITSTPTIKSLEGEQQSQYQEHGGITCIASFANDDDDSDKATTCNQCQVCRVEEDVQAVTAAYESSTSVMMIPGDDLGIRLDCDNAEPRATTATTTCQPVDLDKFFPGFDGKEPTAMGGEIASGGSSRNDNPSFLFFLSLVMTVLAASAHFFIVA